MCYIFIKWKDKLKRKLKNICKIILFIKSKFKDNIFIKYLLNFSKIILKPIF